MADEKIISRIHNAETGEEYIIGTRGVSERAVIKLTSNLDIPIDWTQYSIRWQDLTDRTSGTLPLSETGECGFSIPMGNKYEVTFPKIGQMQPRSLTYTASSETRTITHLYSEDEVTEEKLNISFHSKNDAVGFFENVAVEILVNGSTEYIGVIHNGICSIVIPYGVTYTVKWPEFEGYRHDHAGETHTAGVPTREVFIRYFFQDAGILAVDANREYYTISEVTEAIANGTHVADDFIAGVFLDDDLHAADRGDGTTGCEFMFSIDTPTLAGAWCNQNLDFGVDNTSVDLGEDAMPYIGNVTLARTQYAGMKYTRQIIACGKKLNDSGLYGKVTTPAADGAVARTLSFNDGTIRNGFMLGYAPLEKLSLQQELIDLLYEALGKYSKRPILTSGNWWSSCQYSATSAVRLGDGGFYHNYKFNSYSVLVGFDL